MSTKRRTRPVKQTIKKTKFSPKYSKKNAKYTLPAEAVLKATIHALESNSPKIHYRVTFPTKLFAFLGRILPSSWMDSILNKV